MAIAEAKNIFPSPMRPHRRQFIIGATAMPIYDDWCVCQLSSSVWLSHCPDLRVGRATDADGDGWVLLGQAIESRADRAMPLNEITRTPTAQVPDLYASWAGRWVLVGAAHIHLDASGLLGCFYGRLDGQMWVSSSPALLSQILQTDSVTTDARVLRYREGIAWFPPPQSRFLEMHRLLPSQVLDYTTGNLQVRSLMPPLQPWRQPEEILEQIQQSLVTILQRLAIAEKPIWLGLTAGYDSRLILAMCHLAAVEVMPFTRLAARMSVADRLLPPQLAQACGYEHIFMTRKTPPPNRRLLVPLHTAGHVSEGDAEPFVQGDRATLDGMALGGIGLGVGKALGRDRLPNQLKPDQMSDVQLAQMLGEPAPSRVIEGMRQWLEWVHQTPQAHLDWRDRYHIEQRLGGWQSSKEQLYDLDSVERVFVTNAASIHALLLSLPEPYRQTVQHQIDLIRGVIPTLVRYPFNPDDWSFGWWQVITAKATYAPQFVYQKISQKLRSLWRLLTAPSKEPPL